MPRTFSEHERVLIKKAMIEVGSELIRKKGIRNITVEDITKGANISKGSFYAFFNTREELLYEIIKAEESQMIEQITAVLEFDLDTVTKIKRVFHDVFLKEGSIVYHLPQADLEYLVRKLPPKLLEEDRVSGHKTLKKLLSICALDESPESIEVLSAMTNSLSFISSEERFTVESARTKMLEIMVDAYANYLGGGRVEEDRNL